MHHLSTRASRLLAAVAAGGLALGLSLSAVAPALAAPTAASVALTATPAVTVGAPIQVSATVLATTDVYSYAVTFAFDPTVLAYTAGSSIPGSVGGFDAVTQAAGSVTVVHSRLGTSPAIGGDLPLALAFTTIGSGNTAITASVSLVDSSGATAALPAAATTQVAVAAAPVATHPAASPTATPAPAAGDPAPRAATPAVGRRDADGALAFTGLDSGMLVGLALLALAALATGSILVVRRRRVGSNR